MEKINKLQNSLNEENIDGYLIPKNDEFFGEYVDQSKDRLRYISNFSGSFGLALILKQKNYLFVDGRYTLQANKESGKYFKIKTMPQESPKKIFKKKKLKIGYDPRLFTYKILKILFAKTSFKLIPIYKNLVDKIWIRGKAKKVSKFYTLSNKSGGQSLKVKFSRILSTMKRKRADFYFITASENIAWLLNIRGKDTNYAPLPNSYLLINKKRNLFFCDPKKLSHSFKKKFSNMIFINSNKIEYIFSKIKEKKFIIDKETCSIFFEKNILINNKILDRQDIIYFLKSIKTFKEIKNIKEAHLYDGVALTRYLFWIKKNFKKKSITEISGEKKLLSFRKKNKKFKYLSFPTISGTGPNASIIHYRANKRSNRKLKKGDIYLIDSGGQYHFGTTDVTRTISLENKNKRIKNIFTRVLKGHIAVANFKLNNYTSGSKIDSAARKYLKKINLDYAHGTGHGVGFFLNVHEGPHAISKNNKILLKEGMIISNEPGYYEKNKFGIRIENLIYVRKEKKRIFFDNLTMAPIDKSLIDISIMNKEEIDWLNSYHKRVLKNLRGLMKKNELGILEKACSVI